MADVIARKRGAIWGQFVGDAAALGSHWHYNLAERERLYPAGIHGFERPVAGHYHAGREPGEATHYGDAALVLLHSVALQGRADPVDYGRAIVRTFGDPAYRGYLDKPTRLLLEAWRAHERERPGEDYPFTEGPDDAQNVTTSRLAPVVVRHLDDPDLERVVVAVTRVCQGNDEAVAHALLHARILRRLLHGEPLEATLVAVLGGADGPVPDAVVERWQDARRMRGQDVTDATGEFGRSCYLSCTFPSCLQAALRHGDDAAAAILETVRAGGDNASRAAVVGAWMGAAHGLDAIPAVWRDQLARRDEIATLTETVVGA